VVLVTVVLYALCWPLWVVTRPVDPARKVGHWVARLWGRTIFRVNPFWALSLRGAENIPRDRPVVIVSNHQSLGDVLVLFHLPMQFKWVSKASVFRVPLVGWFMHHAGYIALQRNDRRSIVACMKKARDYLQEGLSVLLFPEGTRSLDGTVGPFKNGAFSLAVQTGADILPVTLHGTGHILPRDGWRFNPAKSIGVTVDPPMPVKGLSDKDVPALASSVRALIQQRLNEISAAAERPGVPTTDASSDGLHDTVAQVAQVARVDRWPSLADERLAGSEFGAGQ
jgi:1-acyl-sn-glycerol-3-phosphate acyltransferase